MWFKLTTLVVIDTDCTGSCKSNYHMITATTAPHYILHHKLVFLILKGLLTFIIYVHSIIYNNLAFGRLLKSDHIGFLTRGVLVISDHWCNICSLSYSYIGDFWVRCFRSLYRSLWYTSFLSLLVELNIFLFAQYQIKMCLIQSAFC